MHPPILCTHQMGNFDIFWKFLLYNFEIIVYFTHYFIGIGTCRLKYHASGCRMPVYLSVDNIVLCTQLNGCHIFNRRTSPLGNDRITMFPNSSVFSSRPLYFIVYWCTFLEFSSNEPVATSKLCSPNKKDSNNRKIPATNKVKRCIPQMVGTGVIPSRPSPCLLHDCNPVPACYGDRCSRFVKIL